MYSAETLLCSTPSLVCKCSIALFEFVHSALAQEVLVALQPVLQQEQLSMDLVGAHSVVGGNIHARAF